MKNYKKYLRALTVVLSLLFSQTLSFAQCDDNGTCDFLLGETNATCPGDCPACNNDGVCDSGEDAGSCLDCFEPPTGLGAPIKPSAGDDPCIATPLKTGLACIQYSNDTSTATTNPGTPACWASVTKDVWFSFTATSEDMTVSTDAVIFEIFPGTANNDTELALYSGACASLTELNCNQDEGINSGIDLSQGKSSPTRQALVERTGLTVGETYYLRVQGVAGTIDIDGVGNFCVSAFDTYTVGSRSCEAQAIHPNNIAGTCDYNNGNAVKNKISTGAYDPATTMEANAYVPLGKTYSCAPQITASMYGGWVKWTAEDNSDITVENISGGGRDYTLFDATICVNLNCIDSRTGIAAGGTTTFTGMVAGTKYYLLTTLSSGATTDGFVTDVCIKSTTVPVNPEIEKNDGTGGSAQSDNCPAFEMVVDQVYEATTYAADADGTPKCNHGKNIWVTWKVPTDYPTVNGAQEAFFQMWSKNCTGGPGSPATRLIVGAGILGDPCMGDNCLEFSSPSQNPQLGDGSSGDTDPYTDGATNVGWDPSKYGNQYWGIFQSGNDGSGEEVCTFNFMIGSTPSLKGITIPDATICLGESVTLTAEGATAYEWFDGSTGDSHTDTPTTNSSYTVYATAGAEGYAVGYVTVITPPAAVEVNSGGICSGATSLELTASGAEQYDWSPATDLDVTTGETVNANPAATTVYTVTGVNGRVTGSYEGRFDFAGCSATADATVTVGGSIPIQVNDGVVCSGASTTLTASGADTYTWNPTTDLTNMNADSAVASPTAPITYTVTGESNGCFGEAVANVTMSPAPTITVNDDAVCAGQTATLTAGGGVTYLWEDGTTGATFTTPPITGTTTFSVTGTSAGGCSVTVVSTVTLSPSLTSVTVTDEAVCSGQTATLTADGAATYEWEGAATGGTYTTGPITATTTYTVTGTDASGCTGTAVGTVTLATGLTITVSPINYCIGGSGALTAAGAGGAGTYAWSPATDLDATTGATVNASPAATTTYTVTGTDAGGCVGEAEVIVTVDGLDDANFSYAGGVTFCPPSSSGVAIKSDAGGTGSFTVSGTALTIDGTTGDLTVPGGTTPGTFDVTYTTTTACPNSYSLTVTVTASPNAEFSYASPSYCATAGANPLIIQPAGSSPGNFSSSPAGLIFLPNGDIDLAASSAASYVVTNDIPAANGCSSDNATTNVEISAAPVISSTSTSVCVGGAPVTITASGAAGATYTWTGGGTPSGADLSDSPSSTTTYSVVADLAGCISNETVGTITVEQPPVTTVSDGAVCTGQPATITANGATTYSWSTGETTPSITVSPTVETTYTVRGTTNGCFSDAISTVTISAAPTVTVSSATICFGESATITAVGADTYQWSNIKTGASITESPTGTTTYTVTGSTSAGCPGVGVGTITVNNLPSITIPLLGEACIGSSATLKAQGFGVVTYAWSDGSSADTLTATPTVVGATTYTVTGTSAEGCSAVASNAINIHPQPEVIVSDDVIVDLGLSTGLVASGGDTFQWTPTEGLDCSDCAGPEASPIVTTKYCVLATDAYGCQNTACLTVTINIPCHTNDSLEVANAFSPNGDGHNDVFTLQGWGDCITELSFVVFDRWGEKVFETDNPRDEWDGTYKGKPLDPAVFVFFVEAHFVEGDILIRKGNITLIR